MRPSLSVGQLATIALSLSPLATALSWPRWLPEVDTLVVREDSSSSKAPAATATDDSQSASVTAAPTTTKTTKNGKGGDSTTNLNTGGVTQTNLNTGGVHTGNSTSTKKGATHTIYPADDPAGAVVMLTPSATYQVTQLYRIGEYITFGWNYTNLQGTPTAVDVYASCSASSATWTLTQNMTYHTKGSYTWDTGDYQATAISDPLVVEMYTLVIIDADSSISATAEAGYLGAYSGFKFGLYTGRPYSDLDANGQFECATCSAALGAMERRAVGAAVAMSVVTVLSFTWFVAGFGGW